MTSLSVVGSVLSGVAQQALGEGVGGLVINQGLLSGSTYQTILTNAQAGVSKPALMLGDSIAFGYGSNASSTKHRYSGLANIISASFAAAGIKSTAQGWWGNGLQHSTGNARQYDDRIAVGAGDFGTGVKSLGGASMLASATADWTFTPAIDCDSIDIYYIRFSGGGTFSYAVDGGSATNVSTNGGNSIQKVAITGLTPGAHSVQMSWVSGSSYLLGADGFDSTTVGFKFINGGINGGVLTDFTLNTAAWDPLKACAALAPAMAFMVIGANHWNLASPDLAAFNTNLQTIIDAFAAICPLILVSDIPTNPAGAGTRGSLATQQTFVDAMRVKAAANGLLMFDEWRAFGGASATFGSAWDGDTLHPSPTGYTTMAGHISAPFISAAP